MDINEFLVSKVGIEPMDSQEEQGKNNDKNSIVTYHDPCHLKKSLGVFDEPRKLIRTSPKYRLKEMAEPDRCCGMGGSFNLQYYEISSKIGAKKVEDIKSTGCDTIATGCPACMLQISDMLTKAREKIAVKHPVEIYAEAIKKR